jgi:hypothetical protein
MNIVIQLWSTIAGKPLRKEKWHEKQINIRALCSGFLDWDVSVWPQFVSIICSMECWEFPRFSTGLTMTVFRVNDWNNNQYIAVALFSESRTRSWLNGLRSGT